MHRSQLILAFTMRASVALPLLAATAAYSAEVTRGPYLQRSTPDSVVVVWRTDAETTPVVRYGAAPDRLDRVVAPAKVVTRVSVDVAAEAAAPYGSVPLLYDEPRSWARERGLVAREPSTPAGTRQHEALVTGLEPGVTYYYAVCDEERVLAGGDTDHTIRVNPAPGSPADLRLLVIGDSGTGGTDQKRVFEAFGRFCEQTGRRADGFLHVGDMAYGDGADVEFQRFFFDVYQPLLRNTVCWPAMGNHEGHTSRGVSQFGPYYDAYVLPTAAEAGGVPSGTEAYYSFDLGRAHFVCLDSHDLDRKPDGAMAKWLEQDLDHADADWLIAFWHHPPYTKGSHDSDRELQLIEMRTYVMPILESAGVDVVLSGHSHIYERSMLIDGAYATPTVAEGVVLDDGDGKPAGDGPYRKSAGLAPHQGTVAIVAGHGGAGLSRKGTMPIMREIVLANGSLVLDLRGDTLTGTMIDKHGATRDEFQIVKRGEVTPAIVADPWTPPHDPDLVTEQALAFATEDVGRAPRGWSVVAGAEGGGRIVVVEREGRGAPELAVEPGPDRLRVVCDRFEGRASELEAWLEFPAEGPCEAALLLGWRDAENYTAFTLDAETQEASVICVREGRREALSRRGVEFARNRPVKVELEPSRRIIEVQLNDAEYTVNLDAPVGPGRVGFEVSGGAVRVTGIVVERAP